MARPRVAGVPDERDQIIMEYMDDPRISPVAFTPTCNQFTQTLPSTSHYDFGSPRQDGTWSAGNDYSWALFEQSVVQNLYCIIDRYGSEPYMTSAYRNPVHNDNVEGADFLSRHQYGDAADVDTPNVPNNIAWDALKTLAKDGGCVVGCVEPRMAAWNHFHVEYYTGPSGICDPGW